MKTIIIILIVILFCIVVPEVSAQDPAIGMSPDFDVDRFGLIIEPEKSISISGFITDEFHIGIPSRTVFLEGVLQVGCVVLPRQTQTDDLGWYEFPRLSAGLYNVIAEDPKGNDVKQACEIQPESIFKNLYINIIVPISKR